MKKLSTFSTIGPPSAWKRHRRPSFRIGAKRSEGFVSLPAIGKLADVVDGFRTVRILEKVANLDAVPFE